MVMRSSHWCWSMRWFRRSVVESRVGRGGERDLRGELVEHGSELGGFGEFDGLVAELFGVGGPRSVLHVGRLRRHNDSALRWHLDVAQRSRRVAAMIAAGSLWTTWFGGVEGNPDEVGGGSEQEINPRHRR